MQNPQINTTTKPKMIFFGVTLIVLAVLYFGIMREDSDIKLVKNYMKKDLIDPDSAKFRNVRKIVLDHKIVICGEMNAKNSFGAYIGYKKFRSLGINASGAAFNGECK
jgi:hypothetical protein